MDVVLAAIAADMRNLLIAVVIVLAASVAITAAVAYEFGSQQPAEPAAAVAADCPCGESCDCEPCDCNRFRESFDSYKLYVNEMGKSLVSLNKELRETTAENERLQRENMRLEQRQCQLESKLEAAAAAAVNASDGGLQQ